MAIGIVGGSGSGGSGAYPVWNDTPVYLRDDTDGKWYSITWKSLAGLIDISLNGQELTVGDDYIVGENLQEFKLYHALDIQDKLRVDYFR